MIEIDHRLCSIAGIDKTRAALVSATSLMAVANMLTDNKIPNADLEQLLLDPYGMMLANIIQTLVVHETVTRTPSCLIVTMTSIGLRNSSPVSFAAFLCRPKCGPRSLKR
jgi:hypothetical protein